MHFLTSQSAADTPSQEISQLGVFNRDRSGISASSYSSLGDLGLRDIQVQQLLDNTLASNVVPVDEAFIGQDLWQAVVGVYLATYQPTKQRRQCHPWLADVEWRRQIKACSSEVVLLDKINEFLQDAAKVRITMRNFISSRSRLVQTLTQLLQFLTEDVRVYQCRVWCLLRAEYAKVILPVQQELQAQIAGIEEGIAKIEALGMGSLMESQEYKRQLHELRQFAEQGCISDATEAMESRRINLQQEKKAMEKQVEQAYRLVLCVNDLHAELASKFPRQPYHDISDQQLSTEVGTIEQVLKQCQRYLRRVILNQGTDKFIEGYAAYYAKNPNYAALAVYVLLNMNISRANKSFVNVAAQGSEFENQIKQCEGLLQAEEQWFTLSFAQLNERVAAILKLRSMIIKDENAVARAHAQLIKVFEQGQSEANFFSVIFTAIRNNIQVGTKVLAQLLLEYKEKVQQTYPNDGKLMASIDIAIHEVKEKKLSTPRYMQLMKFACQTHSQLFPQRIEGETLFFSAVNDGAKPHAAMVAPVQVVANKLFP
jgi:hypothetical protein